MKYRGIEFHVLQTIPSGWRWSFECGGISKDGTGIDRANAFRRVHMAIDRAIKGPCAADARDPADDDT
jgi:hypothetical protein